MNALLKKFPALWITIGILAVIEIGVRLAPAEYGLGAGVFLANYYRQVADADGPLFDYVVLGDSKSMSLKGHAPTEAEPFSVYNFSMPAMGPRYFPFFLEKFLRHRSKPPAAVIFAADPWLSNADFYRPSHDPEKTYSDDDKQSLPEYLINRITRRIGKFFWSKNEGYRSYSHELAWDNFSHRYLHLFSVGELYGQFTGPERIFMLREAVPLVYRTYRYRDTLKLFTVGLRSDMFRDTKLPPLCNTCPGLLLDQCHADISRISDNRAIVRRLRENYGAINLGDRLSPVMRFQATALRDAHIENHKKELIDARANVAGLRALIETAAKHGIKVVVAPAPLMDEYKGTAFIEDYFARLRQLEKEFPGQVKVIPFSVPYIPKQFFVEQVHYDCPGAERITSDFYKSVMPEILKFAPPDKDPIRQRGFQRN